jgi:prevent-host-death family protein
MQAISIGVREAKINLSKLLKMVRAGKEVVITDRGKPVGKIVALSLDNVSFTERVRLMEERGWIEPQKKKSNTKLPPPLPAPDEIAQKLLQEGRKR